MATKTQRPAVGQVVWVYDNYCNRNRGRPYADRWASTTVVKSGPVNLSTADGHDFVRQADGYYRSKINDVHVRFDEVAVEADVWQATHASKVKALVQACSDVPTLKKIAALVGYGASGGGGARHAGVGARRTSHVTRAARFPPKS